MKEASDTQLLRAYATRRDEAAFRELVQRHVDLVYSTAFRLVESSAAAADLTQTVFTDLARKSPELPGKLQGDSIAGWLHRATRYAALNHLRDTRRRHEIERLAMEQLIADSDSAADWEHIRPVLDEALDSLPDDDREALLLRYFKNQSLREVGHKLGVSDDAAQKRVSRAVERLREFFSKRGITVGAGGLALAISANAVQAAPAGLALTISTAATLTGTTTLATSATASATKAIAMTTFQKTLVTATVAVLAGAGIYETHQATQLRDQVQMIEQQHAGLAAENQQLKSERDDATNRLAGMREENRRLASNNLEILRLRAEISRLRKEQPLPTVMRSSPDMPRWTPQQLTNAGRATPMDGVQSLIWSFSCQTNVEERTRNVVADATGPPPDENKLREFIRASSDIGFVNTNIYPPGWPSYRVVSATETSVDEVRIEIDMDTRMDHFLKRFTLRRVGGEWKAVIFNWQDEDGKNSYLAFERPRL